MGHEEEGFLTRSKNVENPRTTSHLDLTLCSLLLVFITMNSWNISELDEVLCLFWKWEALLGLKLFSLCIAPWVGDDGWCVWDPTNVGITEAEKGQRQKLSSLFYFSFLSTLCCLWKKSSVTGDYLYCMTTHSFAIFPICLTWLPFRIPYFVLRPGEGGGAGKGTWKPYYIENMDFRLQWSIHVEQDFSCLEQSCGLIWDSSPRLMVAFRLAFL